jgi:hypothetical protein
MRFIKSLLRAHGRIGKQDAGETRSEGVAKQQFHKEIAGLGQRFNWWG